MKHATNRAPIIILLVAAAVLFSAIALENISGFSISSETGEYSADVSESGGGSVSGNGYEMEIFSDSLQGKATGSGYSIVAGSGEFLSENPPPVISNVKQSSATPKVGEPVKISASLYAEAGLRKAALYTSERGEFSEAEAKTLSGDSANVEFVWNKNLPDGTEVAWKISASDAEGNSAETEEIAFVVGATDLEPPKISSPANYPDPPAVGEEVVFTADISDDFGLSSAYLELDGKSVSTIIIVGKAVKAEIYFKPEGSAGKEFSWKIVAEDSSGKQAESETKKFTLLSEPPQFRQCSEQEKPKALEGICAAGKKKVVEVSCNSKTGKWETSSRDILCAGNFTIGFSPEQSFPIIIAAGAIIFISAFFLAWKKQDALKNFFESLMKAKPPAPSPPPQPEPKPEPAGKNILPQKKRVAPKIFIKSLRVPEKKKLEEEE